MKDYKEEKLNYINRVVSHNRLVVDLMILLEMNRDKLPFEVGEWELMQRAMKHDTDKFEKDYANAIVSIYADELDPEKDIEEIDKRHSKHHNHHEINPHHFGYHEKHGSIPSNVDICEICCDWVASAEKPRYKEQRGNTTLTKEVFYKYILTEDSQWKPLEDKFVKVFDLIEELRK